MVVDGQMVVRPMMYLALTYDHRIIDGRDSVQFLVAIKECLEDPARRCWWESEPQPKLSWRTQFDVIVIGAGPAGYPVRDSRRPEQAQGRLHRRVAEQRRQLRVRRHLPQRGMHSFQGVARITELYHRAQNEFATHGIKVGDVSVDVAAMQKRKAAIVKAVDVRHHGTVQVRGRDRLAGPRQAARRQSRGISRRPMARRRS